MGHSGSAPTLARLFVIAVAVVLGAGPLGQSVAMAADPSPSPSTQPKEPPAADGLSGSDSVQTDSAFVVQNSLYYPEDDPIFTRVFLPQCVLEDSLLFPGSIGDDVDVYGDGLTAYANVAVSGTTLRLTDFAVQGAQGVGGFMRLVEQLKSVAAAEGYTTLVISGQRFSGANPGKVVEFTFDLAGY